MSSRRPEGPLPLSSAAMDSALRALAGRRVLVAGDLMMDRYLSGVADRISPEAPVPVLHVSKQWSRVGGAGNVAANLKALGGECELLGVVGDDRDGEALRGELEAAGIGLDGVVTDRSRPTTVKTRLVARGQQVARFDVEEDGPLGGDVASVLLEVAQTLLDQVDGVAIEDYNKGVLAQPLIRTLIEGAATRGIPVVVDPKRHHFFEFHGATVFKPNAKELADALGEPLRPDDPAWTERVRSRLGTDYLLLTRGDSGMLLAGPEQQFHRIPATARSVFDVSGAGDTVTAVVALCQAAGLPMLDTALLANDAAGIGVGKAGVVAVQADELRDLARLRGAAFASDRA